jgi:Chitobiase/beta-hexosaminidase C-terminal domain
MANWFRPVGRLLSVLFSLCLLFAPGAFAATYTVPSLTGASIQTTMNTAAGTGSGNTVFLPAGLYNVSSSITVPCGIAVTGPVATPATAILNATFSGNDIFTMGGCTGNVFEYLGFKNTGGIYANGTTLNITVTHNQFGGLPSSAGGSSSASAAVYIDGYPNTATNWTLTYNTFGDANSCTAVFARPQDDGGYCIGIYEQTHGFINGIVQFNTFYHVEEGLHWHQQAGTFSVGNPQSWVDGGSIQYNYFINFHRIAVEIQTGVINHTITVSDNVFQNPLNVNYGTFAISMACCNAGSQQGQASGIPNPAQHTDNNLIITNTTVVQIGPFQTFNAPSFGIEWWGGVGSTADNNFVEGPWNLMIAWGYGIQPWFVRNNYLCATPPTPSGPGSQFPFYIYNEESQSNPPTQSGNTTTPTCTQQTSSAPAISPASGSYTSPPTVTLTNGGRNTSTYYTTDGSTPVPGSGTTRLYTAPFAITLPVTVKAVGLWGVAPQPTSYAAPYGFVPSAVQSASYSSSGGVVLSSVALSNVGTVHALTNGSSIQMNATCTYSDGSTSNCNTPDSHGNGVSAWNSSGLPVTISSSGLARASTVGTATITATVAGMTTPAWGFTVTAPVVSLSGVSLATTGGVSSLTVGAVNQLIASCSYSDGSTTNCSRADAHGNDALFSSTAPGSASVDSNGVVTGVAAGGTSLGASVTAGMVQSQWGQTQSDVVGFTSSGYINSTYFVFGSEVGGYAGSGGTCSFFLPSGTLTLGTLFDCGLILAPTPTTQATSWLCYGTYTVTSTTAPNAFVTVPMSNCGTIPAGTATWVSVATNAPGTPHVGFYDCGGSGCAGAAPTLGNGTYGYRYIATPYGVRSGMATAMLAGGSQQVSQFVTLGQPALNSNAVPLTVTAAVPSLVSAYLTTPGSVSTLVVGSTLQFAAHCVYSNGTTTDCTVADIHGNAVTTWLTSDATKLTVGAAGGTSPGLGTAVAAGSATVQAQVGSVTSSAFAVTVTNVAVTLTGVSLGTASGATGLFVGSTNALQATCTYSDGSTTNCTTVDGHGSVAGGYSSSVPAHATVNAVTGVVTGVAPGGTTLQASVGSVVSGAIPLTVLAVPTGKYTITISGPVQFTGVVVF